MEQIWRGRLWTVLILGTPAGLLFGLLQLGNSNSWGRALLAGVTFGVLFGVAMSLVVWNGWKAATKLSPQERLAVARSVMKGEPITDPRLAPAVLEYATKVRRNNDRGRRYRWTLWIWPTLTLGYAVAETINASTREAVFSWGLAIFWIVFMLTQRRRERATVSHAAHAENSARQLLDA